MKHEKREFIYYNIIRVLLLGVSFDKNQRILCRKASWLYLLRLSKGTISQPQFSLCALRNTLLEQRLRSSEAAHNFIEMTPVDRLQELWTDLVWPRIRHQSPTAVFWLKRKACSILRTYLAFVVVKS